MLSEISVHVWVLEQKKKIKNSSGSWGALEKNLVRYLNLNGELDPEHVNLKKRKCLLCFRNGQENHGEAVQRGEGGTGENE